MALLIGRWQARRHLRAALLAEPEVQALLQRMVGPALASAADGREPGVAVPAAGTATPTPTPATTTVRAITWAGAIAVPEVPAWLAAHSRWQATTCLAAGLGSPTDDLDVISRLDARDPSPVLVLARGWEPPVLELLDVLDALVHHLETAPVLVVPVPDPHSAMLDEAALTAWRAQLARLGAARVHLEVADAD